jgi:hypothetical protein
MALRFVDSFDIYATANLTEGRWNSTSAGTSQQVVISAGNGRRSTASLRLDSTGASKQAVNARKTLDDQATWIVGFAYKTSAVNAFAHDILSLRDGGTTQVDFVVNTDGTITATRNGTALGTSSGATISSGTFAYLECLVTISDTVGVVTVTINGSQVLNLTGQDTKATANAYASEIILGNLRLTSGTNGTNSDEDFDDLYICDGTGSAPYQTFLGDCRVDAVAPTSDDLAQFTRSTGTTNFGTVDESAPNSTDYNSDATIGDIDRFGYAALPVLTSATVYAVQVSLYATNPEGGGRSIASHVKSGASTADGATVALSNAFQYYQQIHINDPATGVQWASQSAVDAATFGYKVAA